MSVPPWSTTMLLARMVSVSLVMSLALAMTSTVPATTTVPSRVVSDEMVNDGRMQLDEAASQPEAPHACVWFQVVPLASQVSRLVPLQRLVPGVQPPVHRPALQVTGQFELHSQAEPAELQISTALPLQR